MPEKHPYVSTTGGLNKIFMHFRKSFPITVTAETLRKLGYAPKNESYILNVLRFLDVIDEEGKRTHNAQTVFSQQADEEFAKQFASIVKKAYSSLFELYGDEAWRLSQDKLITFFRSSDQTTELVGKRQTSTFQLLAALAGYTDISAITVHTATPKLSKKGSSKKSSLAKRVPTPKELIPPNGAKSGDVRDNFGLTVRIEINIPSDGDQETYDRIFQSLRENLLNG